MPRRPARAFALLVVAVALGPPPATADPSSPAVEERRQSPANATADTEYNRGVRARVARDWTGAEQAFRRVIALRADVPDAWNELGYALRQQGRFVESLDAYREALRLRPDFPEALEYLGEAYVELGRLSEARLLVDRLRVLDPPRARELAETIDKRR